MKHIKHFLTAMTTSKAIKLNTQETGRSTVKSRNVYLSLSVLLFAISMIMVTTSNSVNTITDTEINLQMVEGGIGGSGVITTDKITKEQQYV